MMAAMAKPDIGYIDPSEVNFKRMSDGNWMLYAAALQTPIQGSSLLQQEAKRAIWLQKVLTDLSKEDY